MYAALIACALAVIALVVFALRSMGVAQDLGTSEADRDRLELELRELAEAEDTEADALRAALKVKAEELANARKEISRRRRRGDGLNRLRVLSKAAGEAAGDDHEGQP